MRRVERKGKKEGITEGKGRRKTNAEGSSKEWGHPGVPPPPEFQNCTMMYISIFTRF